MNRGVIIVSGVPGAGKSTIARMLAERFDRAVHVEADALQQMIVSGARWPGEAPQAEGYQQLRLRGRNACLLADSFRDAGFLPVVDDIVIGERLVEYLSDLTTRPVYLVLLLPNLREVRARNAEREKADAFHEAEMLDAVARHQTQRLGMRLDTTRLTPVESVDQILRELESRARID